LSPFFVEVIGMAGIADLEMMIEPVVSGLGCDLWGVEQITRGRHTSLKVYIDTANGITVEDCEKISRQLSSIFDVEDPIPGNYALEVSSPGMDRILFRLDQYTAFIGEGIKLTLKAPFEGRKNFKGSLTGIEGDEVIIRIDDEEFFIPYENIHRAHLVPDFSRSSKSVH